MPKAYICNDRYEPTYATVIFAETAGKARSRAMRSDVFDDPEWVNIYVKRVPELDKEYRGHEEMYWDNEADRRALVNFGWCCDPEFWIPDDCRVCPATDLCDFFKEKNKEVREDA